MASSSRTDDDEALLRNLEVECHYLSQALAKLSRNSPEWDFLRQKLEAAEGELEALRRDSGVVARTSFTSQSGGPYRDDEEEDQGNQGNVVWSNGSDGHHGGYSVDDGNYYDENFGLQREGNDNHGGPHFDDASYEPVERITRYEPVYPDGGVDSRQSSGSTTVASDHHHRPYRDNPDEPYRDDRDNRRPYRDDPAASTEVDVGTGAPRRYDAGWTSKSRRRVLAASAFLLAAALIVCTVLFATGKGGDSAASNEGDVDAPATSSDKQRITGPCASFSVHLIPDQFGNETSWKLIKYDDESAANAREARDTVVLKEGPYSYKRGFDDDDPGNGGHYEMVHATACLAEGSYAFILYDAKGDGICCQYGRGEYGINLS